jgi:hypothetical protein
MAAGLGFKDFTTGEVLTAADVDGYLMQGIWVFASAAARDAAVTSPQEGNFAFLKDTNTTTYYTGSAWTNLDTTGMVNPMTTTGDTIYSSSGSTPARLGIGSTGQVLTVSGGLPSWQTPAGGGGKVLQVVMGQTTTSMTSTSTTLADTNLSASITPSSTSSKVLVLISQFITVAASGGENASKMVLQRSGSTVLDYSTNQFIRISGSNSSDPNFNSMAAINYLDSPSSTSSLTYKTQLASFTGGRTVVAQQNSLPSQIILMEIGA